MPQKNPSEACAQPDKGIKLESTRKHKLARGLQKIHTANITKPELSEEHQVG